MAITFDFRDVLEINIFCLSFLMTKKEKKKKQVLFFSLPLPWKVQGCKLHPELEPCSPPFLYLSTHAFLPVTGIMTWRLDEFSGIACFGRLPRRGDGLPLMWPHAKGPDRVLGAFMHLRCFWSEWEKKKTTHNQEGFYLKLLAGFWAWQLAWKQGLGCEPYVFRDRLKTHSHSRTLSHGWFACYKRLILFYNFILSILNV